jgi:16S rRNA processing protein RimM
VRVAALYDVHGNLPALEAVLAEVEHESVDQIVFGGDIVSGPFPKGTFELVRSVGGTCIRGNAEWREGEWGSHPWIWEQLGLEASAWLKDLPETAVLGGVLFCHATPRSDIEIVTPATTDERLAEIIAGVEQELVVAGHTHMQQDRRVERWRFVNAGSVGRPFEDEPGAYWAIVGDEVELRRTEYDLETAAAAIRASGHPRAAEVAEENVLRVPSREEGIAWFSELSDWVGVGHVGRPHGLDGSFVVEGASEDPERFAVGARLYATPTGEPVRVIGAKRAGGRPVIKLDRDVQRGTELAVRASELPASEPGSYYAFQLEGLEVVEEGGRPLGRALAVAPGVANDVLELDSGLALPMVEACVREIDLDRGVIVVARGYADAG